VSPEPVANRFPSGENATASTASVCPRRNTSEKGEDKKAREEATFHGGGTVIDLTDAEHGLRLNEITI